MSDDNITSLSSSENESEIQKVYVTIPAHGSSSLQADQIEQKIWNIVQGVPGLNVGYGSIRLVVYISKGNKDEALKSVLGVAKGIVQSAAIVGSVFIAPVITPLAAGALTGIVTESIQGAAHVVIFIIEHSSDLRKKLPELQEKVIYEEVKENPAVSAVYSAIRAPVYAMKGDISEVQSSGLGTLSGSTITAINYGLNVMPGLDEEGKSFIQKISQSIIQLLSRKILEDVSKKRMSLDDGINLIKKVEEKCDTLEIVTLQNENTSDKGDNVGLVAQESLEILTRPTLDDSVSNTLNSTSSEKKFKVKATLKQLLKILKGEIKCTSGEASSSSSHNTNPKENQVHLYQTASEEKLHEQHAD